MQQRLRTHTQCYLLALSGGRLRLFAHAGTCVRQVACLIKLADQRSARARADLYALIIISASAVVEIRQCCRRCCCYDEQVYRFFRAQDCATIISRDDIVRILVG